MSDESFPATRDGGHALMIEYGDCEFYATCQCGRWIGNSNPTESWDKFSAPWEQHVMREVER